ncbi:MAG: sulfatase-like hydrolase/transferase [Akkermansiaceae bacterium]|nr:sulfatase-like hydrolase/transferase [Akkermansiaceae bacterium]
MKIFSFLLIPLIAISHAKKPNIVFFFTDDHAPHAIGAYNGWLKPVNPTPEIDKLAADGMLFENSFCTNSICGPSRAVIMSGKHSHINGFMNNGNSFDWNQQIFPKILRAAGYHTALYGKSHLKGEPQGFDSWAVFPPSIRRWKSSATCISTTTSSPTSLPISRSRNNAGLAKTARLT